MSPMTKNVSAAVQMILAALYCALRAGASAVAPVDVIVTPAPSLVLLDLLLSALCLLHRLR
jgi:hypothetical protein